jgi:hypothetical protein
MIFCNRCGKKITAEEAVIIPVDDVSKPNLILCPACAASLEQEKESSVKPTYKRGIVLSLIGAASGILIWYGFLRLTDKELSIFALITGWLAAQFFLWGSHQMRNRRGQITTALIVLASILIHQYFSISYQVLSGLSKAHYHNLPDFIPLKMAVIQTGEKIVSDPYIIVIWVIGIWIAWFWTAKKVVTSK